MPRYPLTGRTVAITGSTGGLGTALAAALRACGANLALLDLDADLAGAQASSLGSTTVARGWRADVRDLSSLEATLTEAAEHFGRLDVVIAGAGIDTMAPMATLDPAGFERVIDINLTGVWRTFRAALPHVSAHGGYLLAISSLAAFGHSPLQGSYTASKAGVWAMCDSIRLEVRHLGVGVGSAHPTFFRTTLMDDVVADPAGQELWGGNEKGLFKMIPIETVVDAILAGIEKRAKVIVAPRANMLMAKFPGLLRPVVDRSFDRRSVVRAIELADPTGWRDRTAVDRYATVPASGSMKVAAPRPAAPNESV
ncbi:SDR family NAD(P)-dependent oxidoreductase [Rhodococcus wratislaviensis]|nr:SDR family NAD(P)-dependent oxidoreductase [Rhodococcus sp. 3A]MBC2893331.1 SDR family NAD(P)-dependent oxidoreductase [Rhodococcus sp. 4CII]